MKKVINCLNFLNIKTKNLSLYKKALTHSSYANEHNLESNERLEFLGDAVLELLMSDYLFLKLKTKTEGVLTKIRAQKVREEALCMYANDLNLQKYIYLGKGELKHGVTNAVLADAFEALLGAIYLDKGFFKTKEIFKKIVIEAQISSDSLIDFKSKLQEHMAKFKKDVSYEIIKEQGPAHDKKFLAVCKIDKIIKGKGIAKTKKEAEQIAAKMVLSEIGKFYD